MADHTEARLAVAAFYECFNSHDWDRIADITSPDWVHINPLGGITAGREAIVAELRVVHSTFLKGVTDTPEEISVRAVTADSAVTTVVSRISPFTTPDGVRHENDRAVRTFVLACREGRWLIVQDQNTFQPAR